MTDSNHRRMPLSSLTVVVILVLLLLPLLYVGSLGPIARLQLQLEYGTFAHKSSEVYCVPAQTLVETGCGDWIRQYVDLWLPQYQFQSIEMELSQ